MAKAKRENIVQAAGPNLYPLGELGQTIHEMCVDKGFYDRELIGSDKAPNPSLPAEKLCLIHSEVSETLDALRDGDLDHEAEEVADIVIRVLDYAAWRCIPIDVEVRKKLAKNENRPDLHGRAEF